MKVMVITCSPNKNGLTAECGSMARQGLESSGAKVTEVCLNDLVIQNCQACNNGWGTCKSDYNCIVEDDFQEVHETVKHMDAYVIVTPVYWGEMSESAKAFFDRLRRCEAYNMDKNHMEGKPIVSIAAAGGSGNGLLTCLTSMERLATHLRGERFDYIGVTRKTKSYKMAAIEACMKELVHHMALTKHESH